MTKFKVGDKVRPKGSCGYSFDSINNVMEVAAIYPNLVDCKLLSIEEATQRRYLGKTYLYMDYEVELIGEPVEMKAREVLELVEKTEEVRIKYKKGDKVRVIKKDSYNGYEYNVGQILTVRSDTYEDAICLDVDQPDNGGEGILFMRSVESYNETEESEEMEYRKGDKVRVIEKDSFNGYEYTVGQIVEVAREVQGRQCVNVYRPTNGHIDVLWVSRVEPYNGMLQPLPHKSDEVNETPERILINVENLMEHIIVNKLEVNEILSYLDGYVEGSRF